ncbi:hypothetical protein OAO01_04995 [Oligoflexia bacterium]|nr:hypothetical protein [Oligoflexia bacterium]
MQILEIIKIVVEICFFVVAGWAALEGVKAWKKQLAGKNTYRVAKEVLVGIHRIRDALDACRNPGMFGSEFEGREPYPNEQPSQKGAIDAHYAYSRRYHRARKEWGQLYPSVVEAEVLFSKEAREKLDALFSVLSKYKASLETYYQALKDRPEGESDLRMRKYYNIVVGFYITPETKEEDRPFYEDDGFAEKYERVVKEAVVYFSEILINFKKK